METMRGTCRDCGIPPLVGLLNLPARPLLPGGISAVDPVMYFILEAEEGWRMVFRGHDYSRGD